MKLWVQSSSAIAYAGAHTGFSVTGVIKINIVLKFKEVFSPSLEVLFRHVHLYNCLTAHVMQLSLEEARKKKKMLLVRGTPSPPPLYMKPYYYNMYLQSSG